MDDNAGFNIDIVNVYDTSYTETYIPRDASVDEAIVSLAKQGYLGNAPVHPSFAVSFPTLALLYALRLHKPSLSIESFTKTLCYLYQRPYKPRIRNFISAAFDIYIAIQRRIKQGVFSSLGYDKPDYRVRNSCPVCTYSVCVSHFIIARRLLNLL